MSTFLNDGSDPLKSRCFNADILRSLPLGPGGAKDTSHLLLNKKWIFFAFFGVVFFAWMGITCCVRGRKKIAWYLEQRQYTRLSHQELEGNVQLGEVSTSDADAEETGKAPSSKDVS